jgi:hypothetical protein
VDSATFPQLPSGVSINYRLRYYTRNPSGIFGRSYWSKEERSIQDVSPPQLSDAEILDLKTSGGKNWLTAKTMDVHIHAFDPDSGQVMQVVFHERSAFVDTKLFYDVEPPQSPFDRTIPYTIATPENQLMTLNIWVVDVAGQNSIGDSLDLFWWETEAIVCFPNPFNPDQGQMSTIEINSTDINEARIYDPFGNLVRILIKEANRTFFEWDGTNERGDRVATGGYICVIEGSNRQYCKIAVLR